MKFIDILEESFLKGIKVNQLGNESYIEIFKNPSISEIKKLVEKDWGKSVRIGIQEKPNVVIYAWDSDAIHSTMKKYLPFSLGLTWSKAYSDILRNDSYGVFSKFKYYDKMVKKVKKLFPTVKKVEDINGELYEI